MSKSPGLSFSTNPDNHLSVPAESSNPIISLQGVNKEFDTAVGKFMALKNISLSIDHGEFVSIVGKSGSGKTTLINMLTGIDRPTQGEIFVAGTALHQLSEGEMAVWRGLNLGVVFQFFQLLPTLTLLENVMLPMDLCSLFSQQERLDRTMYLLELVGLRHMADQFPNRLSGGQQQSAAIARALANDPPIIASDEPTGNLDSKAANAIIELFENMVEEGKTILMVTHDDELARHASRKISLSDGVIVGDTPATQ